MMNRFKKSNDAFEQGLGMLWVLSLSAIKDILLAGEKICLKNY